MPESIPQNQSAAPRMAHRLGAEIRFAWKPKGTSWLGGTLNFTTETFTPRRFMSKRQAHTFVFAIRDRRKPQHTFDPKNVR